MSKDELKIIILIGLVIAGYWVFWQMRLKQFWKGGEKLDQKQKDVSDKNRRTKVLD
jgi:uncharacterized protein YutD